MTLFINPGSGPVSNANEADAHANIRRLVNDLRERGLTVIDVQQPNLDEDGRYGFSLLHEDLPTGQAIEVEMPGLPVDRVRYMDDDGQNIWDFPRLYVDGDSWIWKYALDVIADTIRGGGVDA